jgi:hypothetical protein
VSGRFLDQLNFFQVGKCQRRADASARMVRLWRDGSAALLPEVQWVAFRDTEDVMSKVRIMVFVAAIGLATWAAAVVAKSGSQLPDFVPPQIDTLSLLSKAGALPVEFAPEI